MDKRNANDRTDAGLSDLTTFTWTGAMADTVPWAGTTAFEGEEGPITAELLKIPPMPSGGQSREWMHRLPTRPPSDPRAIRAPLPTPPSGAAPQGAATQVGNREHMLKASVFVVSACVLIATVALAYVLGARHNSNPPSPSSSLRASSGDAAATAPKLKSHTVKHRRSPAPAASNPATEGAVPVLTSLNPSTGDDGQVVTISGVNFMSTNGQVVAQIGGQVAPTSCPIQTSCTVTVPNLGPSSRTVQITMRTEAGTSRPVTFHYT
jgi:hypothetical protein